MEQVRKTTDRLISTIYEYQKYIKINKHFIRELGTKGVDTRKLRKEITELEQKITELKLRGGYPVY